MSKMMNPPKKDRSPNQYKKQGVDLSKYKKPIIIITSAVLAVAIITVSLILWLNYYFVDTPYDGIRFSKYIRVPEYLGMELKNSDIEQSFETQKKALLREYANFTELTTGKIVEGNNVTVDVKGYELVDGVRGEDPIDASLTDYEITDIGNHVTSNGASFLKEFQDALIGADVKPDGVITVNVKYEDDHSVESMRGKEISYDITVKKVTETVYPDYTDSFIFARTGYQNIAEYEEATRNEIRYNLLWNRIISNTQVLEYPEDKIRIYTDEFDNYYNAYMAANNITFTKLLEQLETDEEGYSQMRMNYATGTVKEELVLYFIVKTEKVRVSKDEYNTGAQALADENGYEDVDELVADLGESVVRRTILWEKVKAMIYDSAVKID